MSRSKLCGIANRLMKPASVNFFTKSVPLKSTPPRIPLYSRLPVELSCCLETMLPLHSAIASARLNSSLSAETKCWGLIPQGLSMPL